MSTESKKTTMKGIIGLVVLVVLAVVTILVASPVQEALSGIQFVTPSESTNGDNNNSGNGGVTVDYANLKDGEYTATEGGYTANVTVTGGKITALTMTGGEDYEGVVTKVIGNILESGTPESVDSVLYSGATLSAKGFLKALDAALVQAN